MKICSISLLIRILQTGDLMRYHYSFVRQATVKKQNKITTNENEDVEQLKCLHTVSGDLKQHRCYEKQYDGPSRELKI